MIFASNDYNALFLTYFFIFLIPGIFSTVIFTIITGYIATKKGYGGGWYVIGFLLGFIGLIIALCLDDKTKLYPNRDAWVCPNCHTINKKEDRFCSHCGNERISKDTLDGWTCPNCLSYNREDSNYCTKCGTRRSDR